MDYDHDLDARGLLCPLPVLKLRKRMQALEVGAVIRVQADDPAAVIDIPHYCTEAGHILLGQSDVDEAQHYFVRKSA